MPFADNLRQLADAQPGAWERMIAWRDDELARLRPQAAALSDLRAALVDERRVIKTRLAAIKGRCDLAARGTASMVEVLREAAARTLAAHTSAAEAGVIIAFPTIEFEEIALAAEAVADAMAARPQLEPAIRIALSVERGLLERRLSGVEGLMRTTAAALGHREEQVRQLADASREELVTLYAQHPDRRAELEGTEAPARDH